MSPQRTNPIARLLPSLLDVAFLMPLALLFLWMEGAKRLLGDGDTGWHIRAGEWILQHGRVPSTDPFSFTKSGEPWYAWEWLWDVGAAWLHQHGGMAGVVVASMLLLSLTYALLFRQVRAECPNVLIAFGVTFAATAGSTVHWLARPHLFTLLFVVIFCGVLESARRGRVRLLLFLPPLMVIWTNLHGGFFVGILLVGCYAAGELALWLVDERPEDRRLALQRSRPFLWTGLASAAVTLINPYFHKLHVHMWKFLTGDFHLRYISEYQSTQFQNALARWYEPLILLGVAAAAWSLYQKRFAHAFLLAGWLHLALFSVRNLPIYLLVAAPLVAGMLYDLTGALADAPLAAWVRRGIRGFQNFAREFGENDRLPRVHAVSAIGFLALAAGFYMPDPPSAFRAEYDAKKYPASALQALQTADASGNIFTDDEWGDYLIYRLYPRTRVFVDGRFDLYGEKFTETYLDLLNAKYGWERTLAGYGVNTVLLRINTPLTAALKESSRWRTVYDDGIAIVFRNEAAAAGRAVTAAERTSSQSAEGGNAIPAPPAPSGEAFGPRVSKSRRIEGAPGPQERCS
ncbi:MAG: hypothetical protein IT159_10345 [Bryobacterales bacterium]|nr:hypothetical protein [Bryobacterales bacterium]